MDSVGVIARQTRPVPNVQVPSEYSMMTGMKNRDDLQQVKLHEYYAKTDLLPPNQYNILHVAADELVALAHEVLSISSEGRWRTRSQCAGRNCS